MKLITKDYRTIDCKQVDFLQGIENEDLDIQILEQLSSYLRQEQDYQTGDGVCKIHLWDGGLQWEMLSNVDYIIEG